MKQSILFAVLLLAASLKINAQEIEQKNIKPIDNALNMISKLQPVSFNYSEAWAEKLRISSKPQFGFVGTDVKQSLPSVVAIQAKDYSIGKNTSRSATITKVDYEKLVPLLVASIKEQQQQIDELKQQIKTLKSQNSK